MKSSSHFFKITFFYSSLIFLLLLFMTIFSSIGSSTMITMTKNSSQGNLTLFYPLSIEKGDVVSIDAYFFLNAAMNSFLEQSFLVLRTDSYDLSSTSNSTSLLKTGHWQDNPIQNTTYSLFLKNNEKSTLLATFLLIVLTQHNSFLGNYCNQSVHCADDLYCFEGICDYCDASFQLKNSSNCQWNCGMGTQPDKQLLECVCLPDYEPTGYDSLQRLECTLINSTSACTTESCVNQTNVLTNITKTNSSYNSSDTILDDDNQVNNTIVDTTQNTSFNTTIKNGIITMTQGEDNIKKQITNLSSDSTVIYETIFNTSKEEEQQANNTSFSVRNILLEERLATAKNEQILYQKKIEQDESQQTDEEQQTQQSARLQVYSLIEKQKQETNQEISSRETKAKSSFSLKKELFVKRIKTKDNTSFIVTQVTLTIQPKKNESTIDVVEVIPKEIAQNVAELAFSLSPIILQGDPIIMWHLENVNTPVELTYTVAKNTSLTGNTVLLSGKNQSFQWDILLPLLFVPLLAGIIIFFNNFHHREE